MNQYIQNNKGEVVDKTNFDKWMKSLDQDLQYNINNLNDDWVYFENRIMAEVASVIWGKDYYYKALIESDQQVIRAIAQFDAASELLIKKIIRN